MASTDKHDWSRSDAMTEAEREAAVHADPDALALTDEQLARSRRVARSEWLRHHLHMTREQFSAAYGIPLDTLIAWRRHEAEPTPAEFAYLVAIERDPEAVRLSLAREPMPVA